MALSGAFNQSTYGWPQRESPEVLKNKEYAESAFFSGTDADFSAVGTSALLDNLSGVEGYHYVIWGWTAFYVASSGSTKRHVTLEIEDDSAKRVGILHGDSDTSTIVMLPQPLRFPKGSAVNYRVVDTNMDSSDKLYGEVYYSLVRDIHD